MLIIDRLTSNTYHISPQNYLVSPAQGFLPAQGLTPAQGFLLAQGLTPAQGFSLTSVLGLVVSTFWLQDTTPIDKSETAASRAIYLTFMID